MDTLRKFFNACKKGTFGLEVGTCTPLKMNKYPKGTLPSERKSTPQNPYEGKVFTFAYYKHAATGCNYYSIVYNECKREGIEFTKEEFAKAFPYEECSCGTSDDNTIYEKNGKEYLRLYVGRKPTQVTYKMVFEGKEVLKGSALYEDIMRYVTSKGESKKQEALGLTNIVGVRNPHVENVMYARQGTKEYINPMFKDVPFIKE